MAYVSCLVGPKKREWKVIPWPSFEQHSSSELAEEVSTAYVSWRGAYRSEAVYIYSNNAVATQATGYVKSLSLVLKFSKSTYHALQVFIILLIRILISKPMKRLLRRSHLSMHASIGLVLSSVSMPALWCMLHAGNDHEKDGSDSPLHSIFGLCCLHFQDTAVCKWRAPQFYFRAICHALMFRTYILQEMWRLSFMSARMTHEGMCDDRQGRLDLPSVEWLFLQHMRWATIRQLPCQQANSATEKLPQWDRSLFIPEIYLIWKLAEDEDASCVW